MSAYTMRYEWGELLVIYCNRGYMFYTMRKGLDGCKGSGYDYRAMDK
jgi:hypothetical protein